MLTTQQAAKAGVSRQHARTAIRKGRWFTAAPRGVIAPVTVEDTDEFVAARRRHALASTATALLRADHVVSGRSAAILHGLPTFAVPRMPELTTLRSAAVGRRGHAHLFAADLSFDETTSWFGAPVTTFARSLVDLARHDRQDGLMAADAALRERLIDVGRLENALARATGWPGIRQARAVLALASPFAESALESLVRLAMHDARFPTPQLQVEIVDSARGKTYRVDMLFRGARLVVEIDGKIKYTAEALWREKQRENRLRALGYRVERVLWTDVVRFWPETEVRLRTALAS